MEQMSMDLSILSKSAVDTFGAQTQQLIAVEECGELIQAITKIQRYGNKEQYRDNLIEEIADVIIVINQLKYIYKIKDMDISQYIDNKIKRTKRRIAEAKQNSEE